MDTHVIAEIAAGLGVLGTVVYALLLFMGVKSLRDIRDELRRRRSSG